MKSRAAIKTERTGLGWGMVCGPVAAGLAVVALAAGCSGRHPKADGSGTIECTQVQVASQVGGRLLDLTAHEGDAVTAGSVVARLDDRDNQMRLSEARAGLALAQAQLDLVAAGAREEDVQRARAQLQESEAAARAAQADAVRIRDVFAAKSATQKQLDDATAAAERTAANRTAAEQALSKLLRGNRQEEIRAAQAAQDQAKARVAQAEKAVADCTVIAPMAGVVTTKVREAGEVVPAGGTLLTLSRLDEVWLSVYVAGKRLGGVKLGQAAQVRIDGDTRVFDGHVTFISSEAEFTPKNVQTPDEREKLVYRVKITLPNPDGTFKPGMPADGYLAP